MREVELKAVVDDVDLRRGLVERAGGTLIFAGRLEDRRYDTADGALVRQDHVLRLRIYRGASHVEAQIDWKGPTERVAGFKVREELSTAAADPEALAAILGRLGYLVVREIDREISQYALAGAVVRFERYPRMDPLVEVEGEPETIENAIRAIGLPREAFTADRLPDFEARYEARTGQRSALCDRELTGDYRSRA